MANVPVNGASGVVDVASNAITRDSVTEQMQLVNIGDPVTGTAVNVNSLGQLEVANQNYSTTLTTGTITTSSSSVSASTVGQPTVSFTIHGTYAGVNLTFQASDDGTTYYPINCARSDNTANEITSGVLTANTSRAWSANVIGFTSFRVLATAWTSGTANIRITTMAVSTEPGPLVTIGTSDVTLTTTYSGTQTVNLAGNGTNTVLYTNSTLAASTNSTTATMNYCAANTIFYTATAAGTGTVTIYGSSDNTTFFALPTAYQIAQPASAYTTVLALPPCRYYRIQSSVALTALYLQFQGAY